MKRLFIIIALALALALPSSLWAAAAPGTCTQSVTPSGVSAVKVLAFVCVGSADNGSFPSTTVTAANAAAIFGMYVQEARSYPGATSATVLTGGTTPTALYDVALTDAGTFSLVTITDAAAATPAGDVPALKTGIYGGRAIIDAPIFAITGNSANSAKVVVKYILTK